MDKMDSREVKQYKKSVEKFLRPMFEFPFIYNYGTDGSLNLEKSIHAMHNAFKQQDSE